MTDGLTDEPQELLELHPQLKTLLGYYRVNRGGWRETGQSYDGLGSSRSAVGDAMIFFGNIILGYFIT